jgi:hypothetical protein
MGDEDLIKKEKNVCFFFVLFDLTTILICIQSQPAGPRPRTAGLRGLRRRQCHAVPVHPVHGPPVRVLCLVSCAYP